MLLTVDTSAIVAVLVNEAHKDALIERTLGCELIAPESLHWEIGNAFSAMLRRDRISLELVTTALKSYNQIPIRLVDVDLQVTLELAAEYGMYAYDAYVLTCAKKHHTPLLSLDSGLKERAREAGVQVLEVSK
jgi:predicted nucleic acid-binding protein